MSKELNKALAEQAGGDERDLQGAQGERDGWGPLPIVQVPWNVFDRAVMWVEDRRRYGDDGTIVDDWKALKTIQRAALAQPSQAQDECIDCHGSGFCMSISKEEIRCPCGAPIKFSGPAQAEQAEAERPEVVAYADPIAFATFKKRGHEGGVAGREWMWAEPSAGLVAMSRTDECECIIGELRSERDAALARVAELEDEIIDHRNYTNACRKRETAAPYKEGDDRLLAAEKERDAALTKVAELEANFVELEKQEPVAFRLLNQLGEVMTEWHDGKPPEKFADLCGNPVVDIQVQEAYAAPVAQAQHSVPELDQSRSALTEAQMRRIYENSTDAENERLGFAAFARLMRRAEAVHQIAAAPGKEGL